MPLKLLLVLTLAACGTPPAAVGCTSDSDCADGRCETATGVCISWPARDAGAPDLELADLGAPVDAGD